MELLREAVMKTWKLALLALVGMTWTGCRTDPGQSALERSNRILEDEVYRLREQVRDLQDALECQSATATATRPAGPAGVVPPGAVSPPGAVTPPGVVAPPVVEQREGLPPPAPAFSRPAPAEEPDVNVEIPKDGSPRRPSSKPKILQPGGPSQPLPGKSAANRSTGVALAAAAVTPVSNTKVAQITLNAAATGAYGGATGASRPGDAGLRVVIEPRDVMGKILPAPADVNIVVLDPALSGEAARVARWDLAAADTTAAISDAQRPGLRLDLPWPGGAPAHNRLRLFVRYTTRDGRRLQTERPLDVSTLLAPKSGWAPAEDRSAPQPAAPAAAWHTVPMDSKSPSPSASEDQALKPAAHSAEPEVRRPAWSPER
jgi:hypothetical protein